MRHTAIESDAPGAKKFAVKLELFVWNHSGSQSARPNERADHVGLRASLAARERNGLPHVDQRLCFTQLKLQRGGKRCDNALINPSRKRLEDSIECVLGSIDIALSWCGLQSCERQLVAAVDAVASGGRRSPLAARTVSHVLAQGFLALRGSVVCWEASRHYTRGCSGAGIENRK